MIIKHFFFKKNIDQINNYNSILFYGSNDGLKSDFISIIKRIKKKTELTIIFENEILKNEIILYDFINNNSLFAAEKILIIYDATDSLFNLIKEINEKLFSSNNKIYIFTENLDKKSKLRSYFEKDEKLAIVPLYQDDEKVLQQYIKFELKEFKGVTNDICSIIIENSKLNRKIIQNEIEKIRLYFTKKEIYKKELLELLNIEKEDTLDEIKDAILLGNKNKLNKILSNKNFSKEEIFIFISFFNLKLKKLQEMLCNSDNTSLESLIESFKPPIFWKDKPIIKDQLYIWKNKNMKKLINLVSETEIIIRKNYQIEHTTVLNNLLVNICNEATS